MSGLTLSQIEAQLVAIGVPPEKAHWQAMQECGLASPAPKSASRIVAPSLPPAQRVKAVTAGLDGEARRVEGRLLEGGGLALLIPYPPRTKKNHGRAFGIKQSVAYVRYRDFIIAMMTPLLGPLGLPLPLRPYNLKALYYVDPKGKTADLFGLHQGLADALQNAEVIADDWWFRTTNGSAVILNDPNPRIEIEITPLPDPSAPPSSSHR